MKLALGWTSVNKKILELEAIWSPVEHHNQGWSYNRKMVLNVSSRKRHVRLTVYCVTCFPKISLHYLRRRLKNISLFLKVNSQNTFKIRCAILYVQHVKC